MPSYIVQENKPPKANLIVQKIGEFEQQLFTSGSFEIQRDLVVVYFSVELVVQVGDHPIGTRFSSAVIDFEDGIVVFCRESLDEVVVVSRFKLKMIVGERI